ncbi:hypothetical protein EDB81DRAFT_858181 [Dactylonectria macrodidyma]|uniref:Uncharacterized protein n=1 Tax=Dactylonectria macrodidyma TaxID=307937 RepID=A0A9P9EGR0_9HYPO|nr:hypothetical protein EDB81DRAFT_858181 [Dactylonectria macrodidyma]
MDSESKYHAPQRDMEGVTDDSDGDFTGEESDGTEFVVSDSEDVDSIELSQTPSEYLDQVVEVSQSMGRSNSVGSGRCNTRNTVGTNHGLINGGSCATKMRVRPRHIANCQFGVLYAMEILEKALQELERGLSTGSNSCGGVCDYRQTSISPQSTHNCVCCQNKGPQADYLNSPVSADVQSQDKDRDDGGSNSDVPLLRSRFCEYRKS